MKERDYEHIYLVFVSSDEITLHTEKYTHTYALTHLLTFADLETIPVPDHCGWRSGVGHQTLQTNLSPRPHLHHPLPMTPTRPNAPRHADAGGGHFIFFWGRRGRREREKKKGGGKRGVLVIEYFDNIIRDSLTLEHL